MNRIYIVSLLLIMILSGCNYPLLKTMSESQQDYYKENDFNYDRINDQTRRVKKKALDKFIEYTGEIPDTLYLTQRYIWESSVFQGRIWNSSIELQYETSYPYRTTEATMSIRLRDNDSIINGINHYDFEEYQYLLENWSIVKLKKSGPLEQEVNDNPLILATIAFIENDKWEFKNVLFYPF